MTNRIVVLISGGGTNLQAILDACTNNVIPGQVVRVVSNRSRAAGLSRAEKANVPTTTILWDRDQEPRERYDARVAAVVMEAQPNLIVLAGWMHLFTAAFLRHFHGECVVNLHPALPGQFPGTNAIERAYASNVPESGVMVHTVVPEVDAGRTVLCVPVARHPRDDLDAFRNRIRYVEKAVLVAALAKQLVHMEPVRSAAAPVNAPHPPTLVARGKVRDVYAVGTAPDSTPCLMMVATDRLSSFDRNVCTVPNKGHVLNRLSGWWFARTEDIVPNHLLWCDSELPVSVVKRCEVFPVEFVVRSVITGTTGTSMWVRYQAGQRRFGGVLFPDGMRKNQRLRTLIVDPTTKSDVHDEPVTKSDVIQRELMSAADFDQCEAYALALFERGAEIAAKRGLMLADTKYEFGKDTEGRVVLVDEIHTCDSSRFWDLPSYRDRFEAGEPPKRFDKDMVREWLRSQCDPYTAETLPSVPPALIRRVSDVYMAFYERLTGGKFAPGFAPHSIALSAFTDRFMRRNNKNKE